MCVRNAGTGADHQTDVSAGVQRPGPAEALPGGYAGYCSCCPPATYTDAAGTAGTCTHLSLSLSVCLSAHIYPPLCPESDFITSNAMYSCLTVFLSVCLSVSLSLRVWMTPVVLAHSIYSWSIWWRWSSPRI